MNTKILKTSLKSKIEDLDSKLENGGDVSLRRIQRILGIGALEKIDSAWKEELHRRGERPPEIVKYSQRLAKSLRTYEKADLLSIRGSTTAKQLFEKAEAGFEKSLEYLQEMISIQPDLRFWIDREIDFSDPHFGYHPEGMPYPIWSKSAYARKADHFKRTKRDLKREALQEALTRLESSTPQILDIELSLLKSRSLRTGFKANDFSGFKF